MRTRSFLPCLMGLLLLAGCLETGPGEASEDRAGLPGAGDAPAGASQALSFRTLAVGDASGHASRTRAVIEDAATWETFWTKHASGDPRAGAKPQVDFSQERVVAVVFGEEPPGCGSVRVTNATAEEGSVRVEVTAFTPSPTEVTCGAVVRQPFHLVAIPRGAPAEFVERQAAGAPPS